MKKQEIIDISAENDRDYLQSLARGLSVIEVMGELGAATITQIASATGINRFAARRILHTLKKMGYVVSDNNLLFLTPKTLRLGYAYLSTNQTWKAADTLLTDLAHNLRLVCSIAVLEKTDIVYVARRIGGKHVLAMPLNIGSRIPAYNTASGRILFSGLLPEELDVVLQNSPIQKTTSKTLTDIEQIKEKVLEAKQQGWCQVDGELTEGNRSIAVPLIDREGRVSSSLAVAGYIDSLDPDHCLTELKKTASQIQEILKLGIGSGLSY